MAVDTLTISDEQLLDKLGTARERLLREIRKAIVGQDEVVEQVLLALFVGGHSIITGVPGLAKTLLVRTIANVLDLSFKRIQFTPDLMPADITGTEIIEEDRATGRRALQFIPGPIFANIVLADEINRTPPKTQAALLEAMQELLNKAADALESAYANMGSKLGREPGESEIVRSDVCPPRRRDTSADFSSGVITSMLGSPWRRPISTFSCCNGRKPWTTTPGPTIRRGRITMRNIGRKGGRCSSTSPPTGAGRVR